MRACHLALFATATLCSVPVGAQRVSPVAVTVPQPSVRTLSAAVVAQKDDPPGRAPYVIFGALIGAAAVTAYLVHDMSVSAKQNGNDGFIIPPMVFILIGAGGLGGAALGAIIHDAIYDTPAGQR